MENEFPYRRYLFIPVSVTSSIDFSQVLDPNAESLRVSVDGLETFVKYPVTIVTASYTQSWYDPINHTSGSYYVKAGVYGRPSSIYSPIYPELNWNATIDVMNTPAWSISGSNSSSYL